MNNAPVLSVITPVRNGRAHIGKCLDNVRDQDMDCVEHIVVDGGSTDGTLEIVQERAAVDKRVRLIPGPDTGQSHAMNKGLVSALGSILGFLNVDDHYLPGTLRKVVRRLDGASSPAFLWGALEIRNQLIGKTQIQPPGRLEAWGMLCGAHEFPFNPVSYFYHRELHFAAGLYLEAEHFSMDREFLIRAAPFVKQLVREESVLGVFELAPGTKTYQNLQSHDRIERRQALVAPLIRRLGVLDRARMALAQAFPGQAWRL